MFILQCFGYEVAQQPLSKTFAKLNYVFKHRSAVMFSGSWCNLLFLVWRNIHLIHWWAEIKVPLLWWLPKYFRSCPTRLVSGSCGHQHPMISSPVQDDLNVECELWRNENKAWDWLLVQKHSRFCAHAHFQTTHCLLLCKDVSIEGLSAFQLLLIIHFPHLSFGLNFSIGQLRILLPLWYKQRFITYSNHDHFDHLIN